jgi:hypothetical protein
MLGKVRTVHLADVASQFLRHRRELMFSIEIIEYSVPRIPHVIMGNLLPISGHLLIPFFMISVICLGPTPLRIGKISYVNE